MNSEEPVRTQLCIVGAGFSGLGMGIRLLQAGVTDFVILDSGPQVGGTWRDNHYPGCACDVPSRLYSFSFQPNPDWSRKYAPQSEIWTYLKDCVAEHGLAPHIHFNRELRRASYSEQDARWMLECADGQRYDCQVLISAIGGLSRPAMPSIPGLERFCGPAFHSSNWRHDVDLSGKTVGVIGTGASAIQFVPQIAPQAKKLVLFQRTPPWILPRRDRAIRQGWKWMYRKFGLIQKLVRGLTYLQMESRALGLSRYPGLLRIMEKRARRHIAAGIGEKALREQVTPRFRLGCKRVLMSDDYYPALVRENVQLETALIEKVQEHGVKLDNGEFLALDVLVYGTGFQATSPVPVGMILGRQGQDLTEAWRAGPEAYLGTTVAGFPNMFMLMGPNTGLGHNSVVYMIESQISYVLGCLATMQEQELRSVEVRPEVQAAFNSDLQAEFEGSVWTSGCKSWYLHESGKNTTLWPGMSYQFRRRMKHFRLSDFRWEAEEHKAV